MAGHVVNEKRPYALTEKSSKTAAHIESGLVYDETAHEAAMRGVVATDKSVQRSRLDNKT